MSLLRIVRIEIIIVGKYIWQDQARAGEACDHHSLRRMQSMVWNASCFGEF
jgi:hypothetical protein